MKDLYRIFQVIVLASLMAVFPTKIVLGQHCSDNDSLIHYTPSMDDKCLICLVNEPKRIEIISNQALQLANLKERITGKDIILNDNKETIVKLEDENQKINLHLSKAIRSKKIFGFGGLGVGILGTVLLLK